jgi:peptidoglycan hydrolase CwlO-like protein
MTLVEWLTAIGVLLALVVALTAIITVKVQLKQSEDTKRKDDISVGIKQQEQINLKAEVEVVKARVGIVEEKINTSNVDIAEVKVNIHFILEALTRIEGSIKDMTNKGVHRVTL